jgi:tryptophan-rich sensory protein
MALTIGIAPMSASAWLLLLPCRLWSRIGTFGNRQMQRLNRSMQR